MVSKIREIAGQHILPPPYEERAVRCARRWHSGRKCQRSQHPSSWKAQEQGRRLNLGSQVTHSVACLRHSRRLLEWHALFGGLVGSLQTRSLAVLENVKTAEVAQGAIVPADVHAIQRVGSEVSKKGDRCSLH